jgi:hypothetical protein
MELELYSEMSSYNVKLDNYHIDRAIGPKYQHVDVYISRPQSDRVAQPEISTKAEKQRRRLAGGRHNTSEALPRRHRYCH